MHYVLSDIHGDSAAFDAILAMIDLKRKDRLYILGDVIDRGPDGIGLLKRIRDMENATLLLGNHEYMMIDALRHPEDGEAIYRWVQNGCAQTFRGFQALGPGAREALLAYLESLPVEVSLRVGSRSYLLVHAAPLALYRPGDWINRREFAVWERIPLSGSRIFSDRTVLIGHTPTIYYRMFKWPRMRIAHGDGVIDLDCGCAYPKYGGQLGCLRLEDMTEYYSAEGVVTAREAARWRARDGVTSDDT